MSDDLPAERVLEGTVEKPADLAPGCETCVFRLRPGTCRCEFGERPAHLNPKPVKVYDV